MLARDIWRMKKITGRYLCVRCGINTCNFYISLHFFGTANKKSKLINNNNSYESGNNTSTAARSQQHRQNNEQQVRSAKSSGKVHQQQIGASSVDVELQSSQDQQENFYNGASNDFKRGPNLVNKQLVLPIITFPNKLVANENNHLIKPSEYLRSIVSEKKTVR